MKKDEIKTLIIFIILVASIILVVGVNYQKNKKLNDVDRKIEFIFGYTYDSVLVKGEELFLETISLFNDKTVFEFEKNLEESIKKYAINGVTDYKKITNFSIAINSFTEKSLQDYMDYKKIIYFENDYYIESNKINDNNYIGSNLKISDFSNNKVYFKSIDYYCNNYEYLGIIDELPKCNYTIKESNFIIELENNIFKVSDIENFKLIVK